MNGIDNGNINEIKQLTIKSDEDKIEKDIVYEIYSNNQLSNERLLFIIENCTSYLNIFKRLITELMKNNNKSLLETIFERHLKFFDNEMIINLLVLYKNKIPISNSDLYKHLNNNKYKILTELNIYAFERYYTSNYLFNECLFGNILIVKYLVEHGADTNQENKDGDTPLFIACYNGHKNIVKYLVEHGAYINKENKNGETPLFYACLGGHESIVKYLVEHGAYKNLENFYGKTPLLIARSEGHENIVKYLEEHGTDIIKINRHLHFYFDHSIIN